MGCGAELEADALYDTLLEGEDVTLPNIDLDGDAFKIPEEVLESLKAAIPTLTNDDLTTVSIDGTGTFDILMRAFRLHLKNEFQEGRITGAEYTKAYAAVSSQAMAGAINYLTTKDTTYWSAINAQMQALTARTQFETAKMQLALSKFQALTAKADYARSKLSLANESVQYCIAQYQLSNMLPAQLELVQEQMEAARAQTLSTRSDGTPVSGSVGKQTELYDQQITSYKRDAEVKAAKFWTDAWITMKTIDEGLDAPDAFINENLDQVMQVIASQNGFGTMAST